MIGHGGDLHDVGVHGGKPCVKRRQIGGSLVKIVMADDPLRAAIAWHLGSEIILEIDVVGPLHDRRPQHEPAGLLRMFPAATVHRAAAGDDRGAGTIPNEPLHLHSTLEIIEP